MAWEIVIGIETHAQLLTKSKIFSRASTAFGAEPNTQASAVDLALPGTLPVLNKHAVELAIRFGLAIQGKINSRSVFARKNYFYPDLPKGYQISQYELPVVQGGELVVNGKTIRITRAHLEEDAGKSLHEDFHGMTGIDLNRAGTPLLEIVTEPDLRGAKEAVAYAKALHGLVTWIGICDGNMQEGSFRCDANVSVRKQGSDKLGTRCEIKNLNSFRFMEQAIDYEVQRQIGILEDGGTIDQETRLYDPDKDETRSMRSKEDAQDYRYFPDPDLLPLVISEKEIEAVKAEMPELPQAKRDFFVSDYSLPLSDATVLTSSLTLCRFFEKTLELIQKRLGMDVPVKTYVAKPVSSWITVEYVGRLNKASIGADESPVSPEDFADLMVRLIDNTVSGSAAKAVLDALWEGKDGVDSIIEKKGLRQISDAGAIEKLVDEAIAAGAKQVADYRAGKEKALQSLVGQVMKASKGKANPAQVNEILRRKLGG